MLSKIVSLTFVIVYFNVFFRQTNDARITGIE
jgi:hypothetical protein